MEEDLHPAHTAEPTAPTPAGWYPVDQHTVGWWNGAAWSGDYAPSPRPPTETERGAFSASFAWWGSLLAGFLPALIIFATNGPTSREPNRFVRFSAGEALNVHLTILAGAVSLFGGFMAVAFVGVSLSGTSEDSGVSAVFGIAFFVVWFVLFFGQFALMVVYVLAAVRAHNGVWWRARYAIPFLRAHRELAPVD
jgi:uncharacterized Tic20 family protein